MAVDLAMHILQGILAQTKQNIENVSVVKQFLLCFLFQFQHSYFLLLLCCRHATLCRVVTGLLYVNSIQHFACRVACLYKQLHNAPHVLISPKNEKNQNKTSPNQEPQNTFPTAERNSQHLILLLKPTRITTTNAHPHTHTHTERSTAFCGLMAKRHLNLDLIRL